MSGNVKNQKKGAFAKFLDIVEKGGNALPHPVTIFFYLCVGLAVISAVMAAFGVSVDSPSSDELVYAQSLLSGEGIAWMFDSMLGNFTGFAPLGTVLVGMLGVGVAESSGLIGAAIRKLVLSTPSRLITVVVVFAGIMSNVASDVGYVILVPLGAMIFLSFGRHPLAGLAAAFAGVSGGFSANLLIGTIDPLLGGISTEAAAVIEPGYVVTPVANYYFMVVSTFLISFLGAFVVERIVEPRLGEYKGAEKAEITEMTAEEKKGLKAAGITLVVYVAVILAMTLPTGAPLGVAEGGDFMREASFMSGLVPILAIGFFLPGVAYGVSTGYIKSDKDIVAALTEAMKAMGGYLVLAFVISQFVAYFNYTQLGTIIAVNGANFLEAVGFTGLPLILAFVVLAGFINLFMGSASAKWAILAPVFLPIFMNLGYSPELTQVAYRIGDSVTNIISPLMTYFALICAFAAKYDEDAGIGTIIAMMLPFTIVFLVGWSILLAVWFILGLPLGPGAGLFL